MIDLELLSGSRHVIGWKQSCDYGLVGSGHAIGCEQ